MKVSIVGGIIGIVGLYIYQLHTPFLWMPFLLFVVSSAVTYWAMKRFTRGIFRRATAQTPHTAPPPRRGFFLALTVLSGWFANDRFNLWQTRTFLFEHQRLLADLLAKWPVSSNGTLGPPAWNDEDEGDFAEEFYYRPHVDDLRMRIDDEELSNAYEAVRLAERERSPLRPDTLKRLRQAMVTLHRLLEKRLGRPEPRPAEPAPRRRESSPAIVAASATALVAAPERTPSKDRSTRRQFLAAPFLALLNRGQAQDASVSAQDRIEKTLRTLAPHANRRPGTPALQEAARLVVVRLDQSGFSDRPARFGEVLGHATHLTYLKRGRNASAPKVVLVAHLDSLVGGADDNLSGVAALIETAERLATTRHESDIAIVFTLDEEHVKLGVLHALRELEENGFGVENTRLINLDSVGSGQRLVITPAFPERQSPAPAWMRNLGRHWANPETRPLEESADIARPGRHGTTDAFQAALLGYETVSLRTSTAANDKASIHHTDRDVLAHVNTALVAASAEWVIKTVADAAKALPRKRKPTSQHSAPRSGSPAMFSPEAFAKFFRERGLGTMDEKLGKRLPQNPQIYLDIHFLGAEFQPVYRTLADWWMVAWVTYQLTRQEEKEIGQTHCPATKPFSNAGRLFVSDMTSYLLYGRVREGYFLGRTANSRSAVVIPLEESLTQRTESVQRWLQGRKIAVTGPLWTGARFNARDVLPQKLSKQSAVRPGSGRLGTILGLQTLMATIAFAQDNDLVLQASTAWMLYAIPLMALGVAWSLYRLIPALRKADSPGVFLSWLPWVAGFLALMLTRFDPLMISLGTLALSAGTDFLNIDRLLRSVRRDAATGLPNRNYLEIHDLQRGYLPRLFLRAITNHGGLTGVLMTLDRDEIGRVQETLREKAGSSSELFRWDEQHYLILLHDMDATEASQIARDIHTNVSPENKPITGVVVTLHDENPSPEKLQDWIALLYQAHEQAGAAGPGGYCALAYGGVNAALPKQEPPWIQRRYRNLWHRARHLFIDAPHLPLDDIRAGAVRLWAGWLLLGAGMGVGLWSGATGLMLGVAGYRMIAHVRIRQLLNWERVDQVTHRWKKDHFVGKPLQDLIDAAQKQKRPLTAVLVEIGAYAVIRKQLGAAVAEEMEEKLADLLDENLRPRERAIPWGSHQFLIVMDMPYADALKRIENLSHDISNDLKVWLPELAVNEPRLTLGLSELDNDMGDDAKKEWLERLEIALQMARSRRGGLAWSGRLSVPLIASAEHQTLYSAMNKRVLPLNVRRILARIQAEVANQPLSESARYVREYLGKTHLDQSVGLHHVLSNRCSILAATSMGKTWSDEELEESLIHGGDHFGPLRLWESLALLSRHRIAPGPDQRTVLEWLQDFEPKNSQPAPLDESKVEQDPRLARKLSLIETQLGTLLHDVGNVFQIITAHRDIIRQIDEPMPATPLLAELENIQTMLGPLSGKDTLVLDALRQDPTLKTLRPELAQEAESRLIHKLEEIDELAHPGSDSETRFWLGAYEFYLDRWKALFANPNIHRELHDLLKAAEPLYENEVDRAREEERLKALMRLAALRVQSFLNLVRTGDYGSQRQPTRLRPLMELVAQAFNQDDFRVTVKPGIENYHHRRGDPEVFVDAGDFLTVCQNLVSNARNIEAPDLPKVRAFEFSMKWLPNGIRVVGADNAGGIPPELQTNKIFDPHVSGRKSTGLGLSMVKAIVKRLGVETIHSEGTTSFGLGGYRPPVLRNPEDPPGTTFTWVLPHALPAEADRAATSDRELLEAL